MDPQTNKVVRVEGKQGGSHDTKKDDVWMAFSIGMRHPFIRSMGVVNLVRNAMLCVFHIWHTAWSPPPTHDASLKRCLFGMQWCARFTRLLPDQEQRRTLVDYMRKLGKTVYAALEDNLRDAGLDVVAGNIPALVEDLEAPEPVPPLPVPTLNVPVREALVVITAMAHAMHRIGTTLAQMVRRLVLAGAVHGLGMDQASF